MNREALEALIRERQRQHDADTQAQEERLERYREAVRLDQGMVDKLLTLFDVLGVERTDDTKWRRLALGAGETPSAHADVTVSYKNEVKYEEPVRGFFGFKKPGQPALVRTDEVGWVHIKTFLGRDIIEEHSIRAFTHDLDLVSESVMRDHFSGVGEPAKYDDNSEAVLAHVKNVNETVDLIVSLTSLHQVTAETPVTPA